MAGTDPNFSRTEFEEAIRFAMRMGAPNPVVDKVTFHYRVRRVYPTGTRLDQDGKPLDPRVEPLAYLQPDPLTVDEVAYEHTDARPDELPVGTRIPTKLVITLFEAEREAIQERATTEFTVNGVDYPYSEPFAYEVEVGGDHYRIGYRTQVALFDSDVYQYHCFAMDET